MYTTLILRNVTLILRMPVSISFWVSCMLQFNTFYNLSCEEFVRIHHICEELFSLYKNGTKIHVNILTCEELVRILQTFCQELLN